MKFTKLITGDDNQSHFEDGYFSLTDAVIGKITSPIKVENLFFGEIDDVKEVSWHNPPCRQYIIMLEGAMEIEIGNGDKKIFTVGEILLAEDTTGQGHITRAASTGKRRYMAIPVV